LLGRTFRVFLVDDDAVVRHSLHALVDRDSELEVVGHAASSEEALAQVPVCDPDVALLDDGLPDGTGYDLCRELRNQMPTLQCLIFTSFGLRHEMLDALHAGASGCVVRNARAAEVLTAIKSAAVGDFLFDTGIATAWLAGQEDFLDTGSTLTQQESELLRLIAAGHTDRQIASQMRYDDSTFRACLFGLITKAR
jgi:two-component system response regulator DevR